MLAVLVLVLVSDIVLVPYAAGGGSARCTSSFHKTTDLYSIIAIHYVNNYLLLTM